MNKATTHWKIFQRQGDRIIRPSMFTGTYDGDLIREWEKILKKIIGAREKRTMQYRSLNCAPQALRKKTLNLLWLMACPKIVQENIG